MENMLDTKSYDELNTALSLAQHTVYKRYLPQLQEYAAVKPSQILLDETVEECSRFFQLEELACKKGEDLLQKLSTVYHASMSLGCNLIVMVDVPKIDAPANIYVGVRNSGENAEAKRNLGTKITDAPAVIGVGPGFCAGKDVDAVIETQRGHNLGRVIYEGEAAPNTGIPGMIGGYA